jgi:RNA polymerase sigma-70 factor (ECF subfamily)
MLTETRPISGMQSQFVQASSLDRQDYIRCVPMVEGIQARRADSMEGLYRFLNGRPRSFLATRIPAQHIEDRIHETFRLVVSAVQRGKIRDPECLIGFVYTVLKRQAALQISEIVARRSLEALEIGTSVASSLNVEREASSSEHRRLLVKVLGELPELQRTVLVEFYLNEKPAEQICRELNLTDTQFRLLKSRAKERLGNLGKRRLRPPLLRANSTPSHDQKLKLTSHLEPPQIAKQSSVRWSTMR